ncbi:MAG: T9SS type A sorting domain-containing protein [Chitinophagaceae bacterium]
MVNASDNAFTLFPNPNKGVFSIVQRSSEDEIVSAHLYTALGQELYSGNIEFKSGVATFKVANALPGMYLLCLKGKDHKTSCIKFSIQ